MTDKQAADLIYQARHIDLLLYTVPTLPAHTTDSGNYRLVWRDLANGWQQTDNADLAQYAIDALIKAAR